MDYIFSLFRLTLNCKGCDLCFFQVNEKNIRISAFDEDVIRLLELIIVAAASYGNVCGVSLCLGCF